MKSKKTNRKFYNKWLYKISLNLESAHFLRLYSLSELKDYCTKGNLNDHWLSDELKRAFEKEKNVLSSLVEILEKKDSNSWTKRIEQYCLDIYTNEKDFFNEISDKFENRIIHKFEPEESALSHLDNPRTFVGKKLPHDKYRFRVYLRPHVLASDRESKEKYLGWIKSQSPKITCSPSVEEWFMRTRWNWDRRYVLVEDEQTLLLLKLRNPEVIGKIYNYVIADK